MLLLQKALLNEIMETQIHFASVMKILIAEDNLMNQHLMSKYMSKLGWEFVIVDNGLQATEACRSEEFNAILMDIDMPVLDGIEATRYIRVFNKEIPIVAITAYADDQMRTECAEAGMNAFLAKPCSREDIRSVINDVVEISTFKTN
jgi:CheY-like chemotaxis protein